MDFPKRHSIRLPEYDYGGGGAYFVTICVEGRANRLGDILSGEMRLNELGRIADESWNWLATKFPAVHIPTRCVMPNHIHTIIFMDEHTITGRGGLQAARTPAWKKPLGGIIGAYKTHTTVAINNLLQIPGVRFWQRNYYERVIRNEREFEAIHNYIVANPMNWDQDEYRTSQ